MSQPDDESLICGPGGIDAYIKLVRQRIADNINVAENTRLLRKILKNAQDTAALNQEITENPPTPEELRVNQLQALETENYDEEDMLNYHSILNDYKTKKIQAPSPGNVYFYYKGVRVTPQVQFCTFKLPQHWAIWAAEHGAGGKAWPEGGYEESSKILIRWWLGRSLLSTFRTLAITDS